MEKTNIPRNISRHAHPIGPIVVSTAATASVLSCTYFQFIVSVISWDSFE